MNPPGFVSVVIATFNRTALLRRLLSQLAQQTHPCDRFEVVVVDDGSEVPVSASLGDVGLRCPLRIERQVNAGAAIARHRGIRAAQGDIVLVIDDDMQIAPDFVARHARHHADESRVVVLGRIAPDPAASRMPLFERWHQHQLDRMASEFIGGSRAPTGLNLYTGNVSFPRADYLASGGFDATLKHSEDADLGLRLEQLGMRFVFDPDADVKHGSDHTLLNRWRQRAESYGISDRRIALKHPRRPDADPWRYLLQLKPAARPLVLAAVIAPRPTRLVGSIAYGLAAMADHAGATRAALAGATLVFAVDYFRGLRREIGSLSAVAKDYGRFLVRRKVANQPSGPLAKWAQTLAELETDHGTMRAYEARYGHRSPSAGSLARDLVERVGLQVLTAHRVARTLDELGHPLAAKSVSRVARHLFGSDVHWRARLAPGILVVHGMGMAISHGARVASGCILFQNVTLGLGSDPESRRLGAPTLEEGVHVGPGCTLIGPITVGAHSKLAPGVLLTHSVPPHSVVEPAPPTQRQRLPPAGRNPGLEARS